MRLLMNLAIAVAVFSGIATRAGAQDSTITVTQLADHIYLLSTDQGDYTTNTLASVGDDGVLLVDTQARTDAKALRDAVEAFGKGIPKYIINTHRHVEHVGGNAIFGSAPIVIAHALMPAKLRSGSYLFHEFPPATFPDITLADSLSLFFNGERIRIIALPGSHDDNELIVHFTASKVVHLSSLVNGFNSPSVDFDGDVLKFAPLVERAIELLPEDVTIVSGHNGTGTWNDLHTYRDMLVETTAIVRLGLEEGKDLATLQREGVLDAWGSYAGSYVSVDRWIKYLVDGLQKTPDTRPTVHAILYRVWEEQGAKAAVERYFELKRDHADEYRIRDVTLLLVGEKLFDRNRVRDAVPFLEGSVRELGEVESPYLYYADYLLAGAYEKLGDHARALQYCEAALELNPQFEDAAALLERIKQTMKE
jgi:cyclase